MNGIITEGCEIAKLPLISLFFLSCLFAFRRALFSDAEVFEDIPKNFICRNLTTGNLG